MPVLGRGDRHECLSYTAKTNRSIAILYWLPVTIRRTTEKERSMSRLSLGVVILLLLPLAAFASDPVLTACVNPGNGNARIVSLSTDCHANEVPVQWNITG